MRRTPGIALRTFLAAGAGFALALLQGCTSMNPKAAPGINGSGIDIRPVGALRIAYFEPESSAASPFETLELDFSVSDDSNITLAFGDSTLTVSRHSPARLRYQVVEGERDGEYRLVVSLPNSRQPVPAPGASGAYDSRSEFVVPCALPRVDATRPDVLRVELYGLASEISILH